MRPYVIIIVTTCDPVCVMKKQARNEYWMNQKLATPLPKQSLSQVAKYITTQVKESHTLISQYFMAMSLLCTSYEPKGLCSAMDFMRGFGDKIDKLLLCKFFGLVNQVFVPSDHRGGRQDIQDSAAIFTIHPESIKLTSRLRLPQEVFSQPSENTSYKRKLDLPRRQPAASTGQSAQVSQTTFPNKQQLRASLWCQLTWLSYISTMDTLPGITSFFQID
ncbi:uncharacterized protein LOC113946391 [Corapipo altera]|uniref:uncharacterized protein LOC113946391 n=1 Tax=Corapipo altera TaxID=415028 RepID=UPI000FD69BE3|nr:uncharacterized protein LOC113946391 [Corapipo altera]